jgi:HEPN domain-containing protein
MSSREADWMRQARRDLDQARMSAGAGFHEWACFAAQQAAEKAVKAVFQEHHLEAWGHVVHQLLDRWPIEPRPPAELIDAARRLDRHYIPTRYPNGFESGAPGDFYTEADARQALVDAEAVLAFCTSALS